MSFTIKQLQEEQTPWTKHNFGDRPSWMPMLGVFEEIGEMLESGHIGDQEGLLDGVADCIVFMSDFCIAMDFDFEAIANTPLKFSDLKERTFGSMALPIAAARLSHSYLKKVQGIRGTPEKHDEDMKQACSIIFMYLRATCEARNIDILDLVGKVWSEVKQRDFKRFPKNGRTE